MSSNRFVVWFADFNLESHDETKSPAGRLAKLKQAKFPIPPGFVITSDAYSNFLKENKLDYKIEQLLSTVAIERPESLMQAEHHIKKLFEQAQLSEELETKLVNFYHRLGRDEIILSIYEKNTHGRKHATLYANDTNEFLDQVINAWTEMFTGNAIWNRHGHHIDHLQTEAEIVVQEEIFGNKSGSIITIDPQTHEKDTIIIMTTDPHEGDRYILSKKNLPIIDRKLKHAADVPKLSHDEILKIAKMAKELESFLYFPQEISWTIEEKNIYIIETKPFSSLLKQQKETKRKIPIALGKGITKTIGTGVINIIDSYEDFQKVKPHDVVVISNWETKYIPHLKKIRGVISESSPLSNEITVVLKQHGIPAVVDVKQSTKQFYNGYVVTVHGEKGEIYLGGLL